MFIYGIRFKKAYKIRDIIPPTFINFVYEWYGNNIRVIGISCNLIGHKEIYNFKQMKGIAEELEREFIIKDELENLGMHVYHHFDSDVS